MDVRTIWTGAQKAQKTRTRFRKLMHLEEDTETPVIRRRYDVK